MGRFAIVCDIDGVVVKGVSLVARSRDAVRRMLPHPFVFVTNDGICSERAKAQQLSNLLEFTVCCNDWSRVIGESREDPASDIDGCC